MIHVWRMPNHAKNYTSLNLRYNFSFIEFFHFWEARLMFTYK